MPRDTQVLCLCCDTWMTHHRERAHRLRLETPYSTTPTACRKTSTLALISSISSDEDSDSFNLNEDTTMDTQPQRAHSPQIIDIPEPERILRSWISQHALPLRRCNTSGSDSSDSDGSDSSDKDKEVKDNAGMTGQDDDYPEWGDFEEQPEGVLSSNFLHEGYEAEAATVGMSQPLNIQSNMLRFLSLPSRKA